YAAWKRTSGSTVRAYSSGVLFAGSSSWRCRSPSTTLAASRAIAPTCERSTSTRACFDNHCGMATIAPSTTAAARLTVQNVRGVKRRVSGTHTFLHSGMRVFYCPRSRNPSTIAAHDCSSRAAPSHRRGAGLRGCDGEGDERLLLGATAAAGSRCRLDDGQSDVRRAQRTL